ncbi:MAG: nickel pincer cofactor biosynthesis protein LarC [Lachnospiraceae bacterium]|nr:nickel pincer cofactor biosynthesis protein LarC [Lachnospiraceae bacterium]
MRGLYLQCESGISGDMTVAALLDLGADRKKLERALAGIEDKAFSVEITRVKKSGLDCCDFNVITDKEHENHDHDMEYLYGHERMEIHDHEHHHEHEDGHEKDPSTALGMTENGHEHHHEHDHHHEHEHDHEHEHGHEHHHHHEHRGLEEVTAIIEKLDMTEGARALALKTFRILAEAEAKAHGATPETVHFHEVGAIDSIVDIVAAAVCFDDLDVDRVVIPSIREGCGSVRCAHGILPVPVPAVLNIAEAHRLPLSVSTRKGELVTPTGAALAAAVMTSEILPETMSVLGTGMGAGKRNYEIPSIVRAVLFETEEEKNSDTIWKLECNIDDCSGEQAAYAMERLMEAGARDVFHTPVYMKKNRPGIMLSVITDDGHLDEIERIIFRETTTIGLRKQRMERSVLERREDSVETEFGSIKVKRCSGFGVERCYPEYESVAALAQEKGAGFGEVYAAAVKAAAERCSV